jgi:hypothetical protein
VSLIKASDEEGPAFLSRPLEALSEDLSALRVASLANLNGANVVRSEQLSDTATVEGRASEDSKGVKKWRNDGRISD